MNIEEIHCNSSVATESMLKAKDFQRRYVRASKPLVLRGFAKNWPTKKWDINYLNTVIGDQYVRAGASQTGWFNPNALANKDQTELKVSKIRFAEFVDQFKSKQESGTAKVVWYMQQQAIAKLSDHLIKTW